MRYRCVIFATTTFFTLAVTAGAIDIPGVYRCKAVRITQEKNGEVYAKGFQVQSLYLRFTHREVSAFGTHGNIAVCRKIGIRRFSHDTVYLENPEVPLGHSELKLFMVRDTIMSNVNLFDKDTGAVNIRVIVEKLSRFQIRELEKLCR